MSAPVQPARTLPALIHVRASRDARASAPPSAQAPGQERPSSAPDDLSARTLPLDVLRHELQTGALPRDTEVLFPGLGDWTPAHEGPELWIAPAAPAAEASPRSVTHDPTLPSIPVSSTSGAPKRKSAGALVIVGAILAAFTLLGVGAAAIYFVYFHSEPVAIQHLPRRCVATARVDLLQLAFFDPLAKKLVPAIDEATRAPGPKPPGPPGPSLEERLSKQARIDVGRGDVREIAVCVFQDTTLPAGEKDPLLGYRGVLAIGGRFKPGTIPGLFEALRKELGPLSPRLDGAAEAAVIRIPPSPATKGLAFVIGQAEDGTILVAPNDGVLATAREQRPAEDARATSGLRQDGAFEIAFESLLFKGLFRYEALGGPPPGFESVFKALGEVQQGRVGVALGKSPKVDVSLEQKTDSAAKDTEAALKKVLERANKELSTVPKDWAGEHAALGGARLLREDTRVDVKLDFRYPDVDRGASELADQLKDPASLLRTKTLPLLAWRIGVGPKPASPKPAASGGAPPEPPAGDEDDD